MPIKPANHWSNYWQQGNLTSLPQGFAGNYDGEFRAFWDEQFALLQPGARVLDVCSGNGSIALLACDYALRHALEFTVSAADAAAIDISRVIAAHADLERHRDSIEFIPDTPLETLALAPDSADLVTSQFGVEYSDWEQAARNISRMLRPGGRFAMVCHSADSRILREMESQHEDYAQILEIGLIAKRDPGRTPPRNLGAKLERALGELYALFQRNRSSQVMAAAGAQLEAIRKRAIQQPEEAWGDFTRLRKGLGTSFGIAGDLLAVNRALGESPTWYEVFSEAGLELLATGSIHYRTGEKAGASYQFRKPE